MREPNLLRFCEKEARFLVILFSSITKALMGRISRGVPICRWYATIRATPGTFAAPAWAAEVVSSNIVGYSKLELANGYTMVGSAFQTVGGENSISVQDIKASGLAGFDWDAGEPGDTLMIWDASQQGYPTTLYYTGDVQTETMADMGVKAGEWFDMDTFAPATTEFENGFAFWIVGSTANATVTLKGEVPTNAPAVTLVAGYNMIANPYPKAATINDIISTSGLVGFD